LSVIKEHDVPATLAQADAIANADVIVWSHNSIVPLRADELNTAVWDRMRKRMEAGGDIIIFEQGAGDPASGERLKANWAYVEQKFGVKMGGGGMTGAILEP